MLAVHSVWTPQDRLAVWAEDSAGSPQPPRRRGRAPRVRDHPFAAAEEALHALVGGVPAAGAALVLDLPTVSGPLPSPEIILDALLPDEAEDAPDDVDLPLTSAMWRVPALVYDPDDVPDLTRLLHQVTGTLAVLGGSTRHLLALSEFASDLVSRGRVLPTAEWTTDGAAASWLPVVTGVDAGWTRSLTLALPASARALAGEVRGPAELVAGPLNTLVDTVARARLGSRRLTLRVGARGAGGAAAATLAAWLGALTGRRRRFLADQAAVQALTRDLTAWQSEAVAGPVRGCFRLVEPDADEEGWRLEFALQSAEEPSLMVEADRIWRSRGRLRALGQQLDAPAETLLAQLARAHRLYPGLEPALRTARPAVLELDLAGAHGFLTAGAPALSAAGFGVLLPGWWSRPSSRFGVRLRSSTPSAPGRVETGAGFGLETMADFQWELAVGDEALTREELDALSRARQPLVRLRGQWVSLDAGKLAAGLSLLERGRDERMSLGDVLARIASEEDGPGGLDVLGVDTDGWLDDLLSGDAEHRLEPVLPSERFSGTLRPYQARGLAWLAFLGRLGLGGVLADDMGLGKTVQLLALLADDPSGTGPTLLVCPMSLVGNWQREAARFTPELRVHVHHGAERARGAAFDTAVADADLVVTTYALAARDASALAKVSWHRIVLDEAQAIKNAATRAGLGGPRTACGGNGSRSPGPRWRTGWPTSGRSWSSPIPACSARRPDSSADTPTPVERYGDDDAAARLRRLTQPFVLRRMKTDTSIISDLPEKLEMEVVCNLTREQAGLYQAVVDDMLERIENSEGIERRGLVLATMTKLKQVCNHPAQLLRDGSVLSAGRSGKLQRLEEILDEVLGAGEKALLFTQYAEFGGMLRAHLTARFGQRGGVPARRRAEERPGRPWSPGSSPAMPAPARCSCSRSRPAAPG